GKWLAIAYHSGDVQIRGVSDGSIHHEQKHPGAITALAFSPDGRRLAFAATEVRDWRNARTVLPWDLAEKKSPAVVGDTVVGALSASSGTPSRAAGNNRSRSTPWRSTGPATA